MPELPEVETTKIALEQLIIDQIIDNVVIYQPKLRFNIPHNLINLLPNQRVLAIRRVAKYLLIEFKKGALLIHLGMSGSLSVVKVAEVRNKHEHFVVNFKNHSSLRLNDPRRFGCVLWVEKGNKHSLLKKLGVEPLSADFNGDYLYQQCRGKTRSIKALLMDSHIVVGIGNIYAQEVLFMAKISPFTPAGHLTKPQAKKIITCTKTLLKNAIKQGGTTIKDFKSPNQQAGYFARALLVYGRAGQGCLLCSDIIKKVKQNGRSSYYCPSCQP